MVTHAADGAAQIREIPPGPEAVACLLGLSSADWHFETALLERGLSRNSAFAAYGSAIVLSLPEVGALVAAVNPRMSGGQVATFSCLRLSDRLGESERQDGATQLLAAAGRWGRQRGATELRGPLLFSTWHPYRVLADDSRGEPLGFPGEGVEPARYNLLYRAAGLRVTDRYVTMAPPEDSAFWAHHLAREARVAARRAGGVRVRVLTGSEGAALLPQLQGWLQATFAHNPYFTPLDSSEFFEQVLVSLPNEVTPLRLGAFDAAGALRGVLTGHVAHGRGVLKTIAVHPDARGSRCAMALTFEFHRMLFAQGVTRVWHALMHEANSSARMSAKYAQPVRHYLLYGASLD